MFMLDVLIFIFSGFWIFIGTVLLTAIVLDGIASIIRACIPVKIVYNGKDEKENKDEE